ncbi:hypothetical protein AB0I77_14035 [Streptomyces sp. NPDC050619]|uniref:hypothetical protein n=1 Tax=Streptomyces sp. NPDC050619 TaxID=3157214 RepID=UPI00341F06A5
MTAATLGKAAVLLRDTVVSGVVRPAHADGAHALPVGLTTCSRSRSPSPTGALAVRDRPGLGVAIDPDKLDRYRQDC